VNRTLSGTTTARQVVGVAVAAFELELARGDPTCGRQIELIAVLDRPAGGLKRRVDFASGRGAASGPAASLHAINSPIRINPGVVLGR
jgi:hypothetical protein